MPSRPGPTRARTPIRGSCTSRWSGAGWWACWPCRSWCASAGRMPPSGPGPAGGRGAPAGAQRLALAQDLHDVLAHDISLINVQAGVALHLLDEHPEQARPALATIKEASRDALHELRAALDVLRRGDDAPRTPAPTLADLGALVGAVQAGGLEVEVDRDARCRPGCRPRSSWPRSGSCRSRSPTCPGTLGRPVLRSGCTATPATSRSRSRTTADERRPAACAPPAWASLACAGGPRPWAARSTPDPPPAAGSGSWPSCPFVGTGCRRDLGRHRRRPGARAAGFRALLDAQDDIVVVGGGGRR